MMMAGLRKNRRHVEGDQTNEWRKSGSFVNKPLRGWLHPDVTVAGPGVVYSVQYLGCITVHQSMRTLQFDMRTHATKEAIWRVLTATSAAPLPANAKRKKTKEIGKILADQPDLRYSLAYINLTISTASLTLVVSNTGQFIANHQMQSISFASGGDPDTMEYVAYVAKDSLNRRACHVLRCVDGLAQDVINTIGQAFELRFKEYLKNPPKAVTPPDRTQPSFPTESRWGDDEPDYYNESQQQQQVGNEMMVSPHDQPPLSSSSAVMKSPSSPHLPLHPATHDHHDYVNNGFLPSSPQQPLSTQQQYQQPAVCSSLSTTSDGCNGTASITSSGNSYQHQLQQQSRPAPPPPVLPPKNFDDHNYVNTNPISTTEQQSIVSSPSLMMMNNQQHHHQQPIIPPKQPIQPPTSPSLMTSQSSGGVMMENRPMMMIPPKMSGNPPPPMQQSRYNQSPLMSPQYNPATSASPNRMMMSGGGSSIPGGPLLQGGVRGNSVMQVAAAMGINMGGSTSYEGDVTQQFEAEMTREEWFHGKISRQQSEQLLTQDGDFLVRESGNQPGQFVLSGVKDGNHKHLLLVDPSGVVRTKDRQFDSVSHLIEYHRLNNLPIVSSGSVLLLRQPVLRQYDL